MEVREALRRQARACAQLGSPMYAALLDRVLEDLDAGGPSAAVLAGHEDDPSAAAVALRLLGTVHRLVLAGEVPDLAGVYPTAGGEWDPQAGWAAFRQVLEQRRDDIRAGLEQPPQTNEVGRSAALMGGLLHVHVRFGLPVRLVEIGTSGGLLLRADHYFYRHESGWGYGREDSPVRLDRAWLGARPPAGAGLRVTERRGSDIAPVDPTTADGALTLASYVWPDHVERFRRLTAAIAVAREVPATVERCRAVEMVRRLEPAEDHVTVLWHSVMWQYLDAEEQAAITAHVEDLGRRGTKRAGFVRLYLEPEGDYLQSGPDFHVVLQTWPGGERRLLGTASPHGVPVVWR